MGWFPLARMIYSVLTIEYGMDGSSSSSSSSRRTRMESRDHAQQSCHSPTVKSNRFVYLSLLQVVSSPHNQPHCYCYCYGHCITPATCSPRHHHNDNTYIHDSRSGPAGFKSPPALSVTSPGHPTSRLDGLDWIRNNRFHISRRQQI